MKKDKKEFDYIDHKVFSTKENLKVGLVIAFVFGVGILIYKIIAMCF